MDSTCSEVGGPRRGFHTFVMTGDAIIRTNYNTNPFKPTRQLPLGSDQPPVQREHCHTVTTAPTKEDNNSERTKDPDVGNSTLATSPNAGSREFIPGFMRPEEGSDKEAGRRQVNTEDSGIDVTFSDDTEDENHPSPRADSGAESGGTADQPSAHRLATRLYQLDGFKISDVCHYLIKSDEFTQQMVKEFLSFFDFTGYGLVDSLRTFLSHTSLETSLEGREKILLHFTSRYFQCNQLTQFAQTFQSEDSCHTLVCALVLLNEDISTSREQTNLEEAKKLFTENLSQLNDGKDFPPELLAHCFNEVKAQPLMPLQNEEARRLSDSFNYGVEPFNEDSENEEGSCLSSKASSLYPSHTYRSQNTLKSQSELRASGTMKGYLLKKHCAGPKGLKTRSGKRGWKRHYVHLTDLKLQLLKSEKHMHHKPKVVKHIDIDNAYAAVATHYTKRKHAFTLTTSDGSEFLFVTGSKDLMFDWIKSINLMAACFSQHLEVEGSNNFPRHLASSPNFIQMKERLHWYESRVRHVGADLLHNSKILDESKDSKKTKLRDYAESKYIQQMQLQRYTTYMNVLKTHLDGLQTGSVASSSALLGSQQNSESMFIAGCRQSYRLAVYKK